MEGMNQSLYRAIQGKEWNIYIYIYIYLSGREMMKRIDLTYVGKRHIIFSGCLFPLV